jgi:type VI protein secretion system component VasF
METNQNAKTDKSKNFKTNVMPFLVIASVLVVLMVVLYFIVQLIIK